MLGGVHIAPPALPVARTPTPTPTAAATPDQDAVLFGAKGVERYVTRAFGAAGPTIVGPAVLLCGVALFSSDEAAEAAMSLTLDGYIELMAETFDPAPLRKASVRDIDADAAMAYAGTVPFLDPDNPFGEVTFVLLAAQRGTVLRVMLCAALVEDPFPYITSVYDVIVRRKPSDDPETLEDGYHTGGVWDMLPTIDDVPSGLVFHEDTDEP